MVNRQRSLDGRNKINRKRVQRIMRMNPFVTTDNAAAEAAPHRRRHDNVSQPALVLRCNRDTLF
jgi:hypothetical protein